MSKSLKKISFTLVLALLVSVFASLTAVAASEARIEYYNAKGGYITLSNVVEEKPKDYFYSANSPAKITFVADNLGMQDIYYYPDAKLNGTKVTWGDSKEKVEFGVKKFTYPGEKKVYEEHLDTQIVNEQSYLTGNYATLSKFGFYKLVVATSAAAPDNFTIQILGQDQGSTPQSGATGNADSAPKVSSDLIAQPTASKVLINGDVVSFEAYNINNNNFFKLRDLAQVLNGTVKKFEVSWDGTKNAISLESGKPYTFVGGEGSLGNPTTQAATSTDSKIYLDGKEVQLTAYNIGGNNYFKLRDIGKLFDFGVTWNGKANTIEIDTSANYKNE